MLSSHLRLGLPGSYFPSGFPTEIIYAFLFSPIKTFINEKVNLKMTNFSKVAFTEVGLLLEIVSMLYKGNKTITRPSRPCAYSPRLKRVEAPDNTFIYLGNLCS
jgi:hypothetical protein